ncbi:type VII secretion-associated serine protease [Phytohabitans flavus]|uniref:Type VII secretion-associated serine protease n=1 Tax=Phytohabitans flavus TaxID=1076124 RepID=A0A6F8Y312_9ACTN|nr:type VII secretion-associated serine protease [Phytohabitans flavus]
MVRRDQVREEQWQLNELRATHAWRHSTGDGVTVAVIDSGVDAGHPDLAGQVLPGVDMVAQGGDGRADPVGHGTTVAGLIAGRNDDDNGVMGLAPHAKILPVRVLDAENRYDDALIVAKGVRWAVDNGAEVINLSLGGSGTSPALAAALDYAFARDVVVVACTGNYSTDPAPASGRPATEVWYPAREPGVLAVTGLDRDSEGLWSGAITGSATVLSAPATGLVGARPGGTWKVQGTSFAAPLVSATAALVRAKWPEMPAAAVVNRLITTASDLGAVGRDDRYGYGLVDPVAALTVGVSNVARNPLDTNAPHGVAGFGPAPGVAAATSGPASAHEPVGGRAQGIHTDWDAEPRRSSRSERDWAIGLGLMVMLVAGATAILVRRRTRA